MDSAVSGALRTVGFGSASLVAHALLFTLVFVVGLPRFESRERPVAPIAIEIYEPAATVAPELPQPEPVLPTTPDAPAAVEQPVARTAIQEPSPRVRPEAGEPTNPSNTNAVTLIEPPPTASTQEPQQELDPEAQRRRMMVLLDPRNAARSSFTVTGPGPTRRGPPAERGLGSDPGPTEREVEQRMGSGLRAEAMARPWLSRSRPELQRQTDGSYAYSGHRFRASVRPDGTVQFEDRPGVQTNGFSASGSFDLTDAIMGSAGQDPYLAEREWFMRHTEELRGRLEAEHRRVQMASGLRSLRGRLERVWSTTSRSSEARRRRIFDIWDEMAEDESGAEGRRIVIQFVRETLPQGSADAFSASELERLNASRESRATFAPY